MSIAAYQGVCPTCRHDHSADVLARTTRETADHAELARLAEAATKGPWKACGTIYEHMNCEVRGGAKGEGQAIAQVWDGPNAFRDGQFIAAANPAIVLALLSEIAALRGERSFLVEQKEGAEDAIFNAIARATQAERQRDELRKALERIATVDMGGGFLGAMACRQVASEALANQGADQ